jgi:DNA-binding transcriptional ArsR family regulator
MTESIAPLFVALADPTRRDVLAELGGGRAVSASALAARLPVTRQAIAKHLAVLVESGLVTSTQRGREVVYEVRSEPLLTGARWLTQVAHEWDTRLADLKRRAEQPG